MADAGTAIFEAIPPVLGSLVLIKGIEMLLPEEKQACEKCEAAKKKAKRVI